MEAIFYQLEKRPNSTKTVDKNTQCWFSVDVELKEPCDSNNPAFTLQLAPRNNSERYFFPANVIESGSPTQFKPTYISAYTHVAIKTLNPKCAIYRITNIEYDNTTATVYLKPDLLASYRNAILESTQFIGRISDVLMCNKTIMDVVPVSENRYQFTSSETASSIFTKDYDSGSYVLGVINNTPNVGSVCYYLFPTVTPLKQLCAYLYDTTFYDGINDISSELAKSLINPMQFIVSCKYFPLNIDFYEANGEPIYETVRVGCWETPVKAYRMLDNSTTINGVLSRSIHPQAYHENDYLMLQPYTQHVFYLEPFGAIPIEASYLAGVGTRLCFKVTIDHISGKGKLYLYREESTGDYIGVYYADIAQDIRLSQITQNIPGAIEGAVSSIGGFLGSAARLNLGGAFSSAAGIIDCFSSAMPQARTSAGGTFVPFVGGSAKLYTKHTYIDDTFHQEYGYICNMRRGLSNCVGAWVQCPHPQLELVATEENIQEIYSFMKEGVYLE